MNDGIARLNALPVDEAEKSLLDCCGSHQWAEQLISTRPFSDKEVLLKTADHIWGSLGPEDWLEAFSHHPKIGDRQAAQQQSATARQWSEAEQSSTAGHSVAIREELALANQEYEKRFGYIFIVCATGKSTQEILALLRQRLHNDPETELRIAAEEQRKITRLRLEKLLRS